MISAERLRTASIASALLILAFGLRIHGMTWGLPEGYEEATPLREAWDMWGWGLGRGVDLNPHFFNYPSLTIYLQFAAMGLLYKVMSLSGAVSSAIDFHVLYVLDKTPFFIVGRVLNVVFGSATVLLVFLFGRRAGGYAAAIPAAFFLAVNMAHISRSQMIEVDVPLTFFVMLALWFLSGAAESPSILRYLYAGAAMGLAMSSKYTGALLAVAVLAAYFIGRRVKVKGRRPKGLVFVSAAFLVAIGVFVLTSPFVILDFDAFWLHLSAEREHMRLGHFGAGETPTWLYYAGSIVSGQLGWPIALLALAGFGYCVAILRRPWALVASAFLMPYLLGISTWEMRADRYLLPALPLSCLFAGTALAHALKIKHLSRRSSAAGAMAIGCLAVLAAIPLLRSLPDHLRKLRPDTRTVAAQWVRESVPPGSLIVTEEYGPHLIGPVEYMDLDPAIRRELRAGADCGRYAVQGIPMFQVVPERASRYYSLSLYGDADYVITTSFVRSRYLREPGRFQRQVAFYDSLEASFPKVKEIAAEDRAGPTITIFKNPQHGIPFAGRDAVSGVKRIKVERDSKAFEADFYSRLGFNYEFFSFHQEALACYLAGLTYPQTSVDLMKSLVLSAIRCMTQLGRHQDVLTLLDQAIAGAPTPASREEFRRIKARTPAQLP